MRHLLLLLILANILYFMWGRYTPTSEEVGVAVVNEADLGPALAITDTAVAEASVSVGAVLGTGKPTDLDAVVGRSCVTLGPFKDISGAETAQIYYDEEGMRASLRSTEGEVFVGHWVQIRNIPDDGAADEMLAKLRTGGLGDAYVMGNEAEGINISLGLFAEAARAERIELQAKSLELPADITPRTRAATIYFVDIGLPPGRGAGAMIQRYGEDRVHLRDAATCPRD